MKTQFGRYLVIIILFYVSIPAFGQYSIFVSKKYALSELLNVTQADINVDGIIYKGGFQDNRCTGFGIFYNKMDDSYYWEHENLGVSFESGTIVVSKYLDNKKTGSCIIIDFTNEVCLLGQCIDGKKNGSFHVYNMEDGLYNGYMIFKNDKYIDDFFNIARVFEYDNNNNTLIYHIYSSGNVFAGEVNKKNNNEGLGYYYWKNEGKFYSGEFEKDQPSGVGVLVYPNKDIYIGYFQHGECHGVGSLFYNNNQHYIGEWKDNKKYGKGRLFSQKGELIRKGYWENDTYIGKEEPDNYHEFEYFDSDKDKLAAPKFAYNQQIFIDF